MSRYAIERSSCPGHGREEKGDYESSGIIYRIPTGHRDPLPRPGNARIDRELRKLIEIANKTGDCIINVGNGYYRVDPFDVVDMKELHEYLAMERSRAREINHKRRAMLQYVKKKDMEAFREWRKQSE